MTFFYFERFVRLGTNLNRYHSGFAQHTMQFYRTRLRLLAFVANRGEQVCSHWRSTLAVMEFEAPHALTLPGLAKLLSGGLGLRDYIG